MEDYEGKGLLRFSPELEKAETLVLHMMNTICQSVENLHYANDLLIFGEQVLRGQGKSEGQKIDYIHEDLCHNFSVVISLYSSLLVPFSKVCLLLPQILLTIFYTIITQ